MRARNLKPGFFQNEYLAELQPLARILFCGLWCSADRNGRLEYRPKKIKAEILPYDDVDVVLLVGDLERSPDRFITRYLVAGREYIQISNFSSHQEPHPKEKALWPAPEEPDSASNQQLSGNLPESCQNRFLSSSLNPSSLNPSSLNPSSLNPKEKEESKECVATSPKKPAKTLVYPPPFELFWQEYPSPIDKRRSYGCWKARLAEGITSDQLTTCARNYAAARRGEDQRYTMHPGTFLGPGRRWEEFLEAKKPGSNGNGEIPTYSKKTAGWAKLYQQETEKQKQEEVYDDQS